MAAPTSTERTLRLLLACTSCRRQYDASGAAAGSRFHCSCGASIEVPEARPQEAAVVRCSACGAPRLMGARACSHCAADFTLHEQDMHTICGVCMTRVSDRARYCHACATPIAPQGSVGEPAKERCPACGPRVKLASRELGAPPVAMLECPRCAGMWLGDAAFRAVSERARQGEVSLGVAVAGKPIAARDAGSAREKARYRPCPFCHRYMNRKNFGGTSRVIVDICREHGVWFDARELEAVLAWIRNGGEARAQDRELDERRHAERKAAIVNPVLERAERQAGINAPRSEPTQVPAMLTTLLGRMFDL